MRYLPKEVKINADDSVALKSGKETSQNLIEAQPNNDYLDLVYRSYLYVTNFNEEGNKKWKHKKTL